jgi:asparagine synthase (glutamine-hydrolysing)
MTLQYGIWHFDGNTVDVHDFRQAAILLSPYAPDGVSSYLEPSLGLLCGLFHTLPESRRVAQPHRLSSGEVLVWDGRLDNRTELTRSLGGRLDRDSADLEIAAAWYGRWGFAGLGDLIGDWALAVWDPNNCSLLLAKDFLGTRQLYYRLAKGYIAWSTVAEPLVRIPNHPLTLCGEYLAGCLSGLPAPHLTPYNEVRSVAPSSYLLVTEGRVTERRYWDFDPGKSVRYRSNGEYEAHFLDLFRQSVRRRLRSQGPVLAELSGGMDSSSIVCVADDLIAAEDAECRSLETISYFSASEPDWDEAPYFTKVEERRGRAGFHVDLGSCGFFRFGYEPDSSSLSPSVTPKTRPDEKIDRFFQATGHRVLLSGIGGDEFLGGVPTAAPELADLLAGFQFSELAHQLKNWAPRATQAVVAPARRRGSRFLALSLPRWGRDGNSCSMDSPVVCQAPSPRNRRLP